ncbi:MAG: guanylate kinase [Clostridia bacterium]|nr:guanylate kinase [Clostridia bacterium]
MNKGKLFILSGPSGSGKDTVLKQVLNKDKNVMLSISSITRQMREGEVAGEKYNFITREQFENMINNDLLLEYNVFVGNYYGTPKAPVEQALNNGTDVILEIDVNGAKQIREKMPDAISIFIMPPSFSELKNRLCGRGTESEEVINQRLNSALNEIKRANEYDYIVVNDLIENATANVISIIQSERLRLQRQKEIINEVLKNVESSNR